MQLINSTALLWPDKNEFECGAINGQTGRVPSQRRTSPLLVFNCMNESRKKTLKEELDELLFCRSERKGSRRGAQHQNDGETRLRRSVQGKEWLALG